MAFNATPTPVIVVEITPATKTKFPLHQIPIEIPPPLANRFRQRTRGSAKYSRGWSQRNGNRNSATMP
jgi:hypothetical protein